jgi:hypothetical protein
MARVHKKYIIIIVIAVSLFGLIGLIGFYNSKQNSSPTSLSGPILDFVCKEKINDANNRCNGEKNSLVNKCTQEKKDLSTQNASSLAAQKKIYEDELANINTQLQNLQKEKDKELAEYNKSLTDYQTKLSVSQGETNVCKGNLDSANLSINTYKTGPT